MVGKPPLLGLLSAPPRICSPRHPRTNDHDRSSLGPQNDGVGGTRPVNPYLPQKNPRKMQRLSKLALQRRRGQLPIVDAEIRNPELETNSNSVNWTKGRKRSFGRFPNLSPYFLFGFVSDFDIRISDFPPGGGPMSLPHRYLVAFHPKHTPRPSGMNACTGRATRTGWIGIGAERVGAMQATP